MNDRRNVFDDILSNEDALTDTLRNFLTYGSVREALWQSLPDSAAGILRSSPIEIQARAGGHSEGYPDLVIYGTDFVLLIEVKAHVGRSLTDNQREAYVCSLRKRMEDSGTGCGMVVFLIPDGYRHLSELTSCLQEARKGLSNSKIEVLPEPITWESFAKNLELQDVAAQNELIREFYHHLSKRFESVSFSEEEIMQLDRSSAMPMAKLMKVVEKTFRHVKKQSVSASSLTVDEGGGGRWVQFRDWQEEPVVWYLV